MIGMLLTVTDEEAQCLQAGLVALIKEVEELPASVVNLRLLSDLLARITDMRSSHAAGCERKP